MQYESTTSRAEHVSTPDQHQSSGSKAIEIIARIGYGAKGIVYGTVGALTTAAAFGLASGKITGTRGAIETLGQLAWGNALLALIAVGLVAYSLWRATQSILDTEDKGTEAKGLMQRFGFFLSALIYASLAVYASTLIGEGGDSGSTQSRAASVMSWPGGIWAVVSAGVVFVGIALYQAYRSFVAKFKENWKTHEIDRGKEKILTGISRFGIFARAVTFAIIGGFLIWAGLTENPNQARGLEGALTELAQQTSGTWLLGTSGIGFVCYGLYCFVNAGYRRISP